MHGGPLLLLGLAALGLLLACGSALFSAIETSFFSLQPYHIERLKARRAQFADALARLMENPRRLLSAILLSDALVNLPLIIICIFLLRSHLVPQIPYWVSALIIFGLIVILCDLSPKVLAMAQPQKVVRLGVRVMRGLLPVVDPLARVLQRFSEGITARFFPEKGSGSHTLTEEELSTLVELSTEEGALHASESEMIQEIIKLGSKTVRDCMTPRVDATVMPDDLTNEELVPRLRAERRRRVPVYGETPDEILGVLDARRFLIAHEGMHYTEMLQPPSFVPETMKALDLLRSFLRHPQGIAVVVDEHGGTEGIITLTDIVEEILSDAVPQADRELYLEPAGEGKVLVDGGARLDDINEVLGTELEAEGIDTIGGLIFNHLGAIPKAGTELNLSGLHIAVRRSTRRRVEEILLTRTAEEEEDYPAFGEPEAEQPKSTSEDEEGRRES